MFRSPRRSPHQSLRKRLVHSMAWLPGAALLAHCAPSLCADVTVVGLFPNKAVVQINGGPPRTLSVNQKTAEGVTLVSVDRSGASFDIEGRRQVLALGQGSSKPGSGGGRDSVTLTADSRGHFFTPGLINGGPVNFVVDTGATVVSLSTAEARRLGISYLNAPRLAMATANGTTRAWRVMLDTVRVGDITVNSVEAAVVDSEGMPVLLGNSFLNRMAMRRDGQLMVLTRRF